MQRQLFQSFIQFLTVAVGSLVAVGHLPTVEQAYMAVLVGLAGALSIWAASKAPVGTKSDTPPDPPLT